MSNEMEKKVDQISAIIGSVGLPACYGGFETIVEQLSERWDNRHRVFVLCEKVKNEVRLEKYKNFFLRYIPLPANGSLSVPYDIVSAIYSIYFLKANNLMYLGVGGAISIPVLRFFKPFVYFTVNIDGLEWKREKWGIFARFWFKFSEGIAAKYANEIISDNEEIVKYVRSTYNRSSVLASCGGEHALEGEEMGLSEFGLTRDQYFLKICRIEPENNIELVIRSFIGSSKVLCIVGNWGRSAYGTRLKARYGKCDNIVLIDPIYSKDELYTLRKNCKAYIHGHSKGGTNPSLVEIMHFCKSIFCYDCTFNHSSTNGLAFFFRNEDELATLLNKTSEIEMENASLQLYDLAVNKFTWAEVASKYYEILCRRV